jgi:hypothetical protein
MLLTLLGDDVLMLLSGMDERNERLVWGMLLAVCREYQAQYFYMAPKFPYRLPFDDQVEEASRYMCQLVMNKFNKNAKSKFLRGLKKLSRQRCR